MSLFPFFDTTQTASTTASAAALPLAREYAWDYEHDRLLLVDGKPQIVSGAEAVKVWAWNALQTERYKYPAFSWNYGNEMKMLFGMGFTAEAATAELRRYVEEALLVNPYITNIKDFRASFGGGTASASFTAVTPYGEVELNV